MEYWSDGVLELPAIFIAGGAGFEIARGMLFPGMLPRKELPKPEPKKKPENNNTGAAP